MKPGSNSPLILLKLIHITLFPVLETQKIEVQPEVTGYLGHDVTLPCQFISGPDDSNVTQVEWDLKQLGGEKISIIVSNDAHGVFTHDTFLQERVNIAEQSLIITRVEMRDAGLYTCNIATFPSGPFEGTTNLVVREQMLLSSGVIAAIVIAVILLLAIVATIAYFIFIRRPDSSVRHHVHVDTNGPVMDVVRASAIMRGEDVVYSDVKLKPFRDAAPSANKRRIDAVHVDDVTYSDVVVLYRQPL